MKKKNIFLLIALLAISLCLPFALNACKNETICLHEWKTEAVLQDATCTALGSESQICVHCNQTRTAEIPALGHDLEAVAPKSATCTEVGHEAYEQCARCDYHTQIAEVSALGHDLKPVASKNATCTEVGHEAYEQCARCDYHTQIAEVSALGHSFAEAYSVHETPTIRPAPERAVRPSKTKRPTTEHPFAASEPFVRPATRHTEA